MQRLLSRSLIATAFAAVASGQAFAQTNTFVAGSPVNSPTLTGFATIGSQMIGMQVTWTFSNGTSAGAAWSQLNATDCGVTGAGFSVTFGCARNTFDQGDGLSRWVIANSSGGSLASVRFNGAPGRTLFDCDWNGQSCNNTGTAGGAVGTDGSANGWSHQRAGGFDGAVLGQYSNIVSLGGATAVGDLFEQLTISFVGGMGTGQSYEFFADTDNSSFNAPPPTTAVPEPSTYAMMLVGLAGIGGLARRRRRNA